jgi:hypothetical protein
MNEPGAADATIRGRRKMKKWKKVLLIIVGVPLALIVFLLSWFAYDESKLTPEEKAARAESRAIAQSEAASRAAEQSRLAAEEAARTTTATAATKTTAATTKKPLIGDERFPMTAYNKFFADWEKHLEQHPGASWAKYCEDHPEEYAAMMQEAKEWDEAHTLPPETKKSYEFVSYDDLARYPDKWRGKDVAIEGKVIQVVEDGLLRISVTEGEYGVWKNDMIVFGASLENRNGRILVDDIILVRGRYDGLTTYTTVLGSSATVPKMWVEEFEFSRQG